MTPTFAGLTAQQRETLDDRGLLRIPGFMARTAADAMADTVWRDLERRFGVQRRDRSTWTQERPSDFKALSRSDAFKAMDTPQLHGLLDDLLGRDTWTPPPYWGQPLVCFPTDHGRWNVPAKNWHLDLPADPKRFAAMTGRLFLVLAPLAARGGGTLVVEGSHRLVLDIARRSGDQLTSSAIRKRLQSEHPWFGDLLAPTPDLDRVARFMAAPTVVDDVPVQVTEITGDPGDLWLMHPAALHTLAPNVLDTPRIVLAQFVYPKVAA